MSKKNRLLALCVSILTIPVFTMGDVPYRLPVGEAYAITAGERTSMIDVAVTYKGYKALKQENAESETTCGTEAETETTTKAEPTTCKVTEAATEAPTTAQAEDPTEGPKQEVVEVAEVAKPAEKPRVEIPTEAETILEGTETAETLMTENESEETEVETILETEESTEAATGSDEFVWDGPKLTKSSGIVPADQTPSGYKETWYPWDLHGCLDLLGYSYDGYQKDCPDGVQRYNGYICVASPDLNAHPKGSLIPTTLGMGIVLDFCPAGNLDIAVTW